MSGPIVRSGPSPQFTKNYDSIFGSRKKSAAPAATAKATKKKPAKKKSAKKKTKK